MRIDNAGNVGIGTSSSTLMNAPLTVYGAGESQNSGLYQISVESSTGATSTPKSGISFRGEYNTSTNAHMDLGIIMGEKANNTNNNTEGALTFHTRENGGNITERMRIDGAGQVGIGTASPAAKLDVSGSAIVGRNRDIGSYASDDFDLMVTNANNDATAIL